MDEKKLDLGQIVITQNVNIAIKSNNKFYEFVMESLEKYKNKDWGNMCKEDKEINDDAIKTGESRIFAAYEKEKDKIWIITEWDKSLTTILFPSDY